MHLLDGQQRMTALWRSLAGDYDDLTLFISLDESDPDLDPDEAGKVHASSSMKKRIRLRTSASYWSPAAKGYGFDFSSAFIDQARRLAAACGAPAEFVETNIYELSADYDGRADVLILTSGAICWMPDLRGYFNIARRLLRPGGKLVVYETHPFLEIFKLDRERAPGEPLVPHYPYFMAEPVRSTNGLDYYANEIYGQEVVYWYHHSLSGILQAILDSGFVIRLFQEYAHDTDSG